MLCTAVALNLEGSTNELKDKIAGENPIVSSILGGLDPRHGLSSGLAAMAVDANGVPFNGSWVVGSGNIAADMCQRNGGVYRPCVSYPALGTNR